MDLGIGVVADFVVDEVAAAGLPVAAIVAAIAGLAVRKIFGEDRSHAALCTIHAARVTWGQVHHLPSSSPALEVDTIPEPVAALLLCGARTPACRAGTLADAWFRRNTDRSEKASR